MCPADTRYSYACLVGRVKRDQCALARSLAPDTIRCTYILLTRPKMLQILAGLHFSTGKEERDTSAEFPISKVQAKHQQSDPICLLRARCPWPGREQTANTKHQTFFEFHSRGQRRMEDDGASLSKR